jgi:hypothetical protein
VFTSLHEQHYDTQYEIRSTQMISRFPPILVLLASLLLAACDYSIVEEEPANPIGPGNGGTVSITIAPAVATVAPGGNRAFRATVTGASDTTVKWSMVSGPGQIGADGLYIAPDTTGSATIRARANADTSKSATATITIARSNDGQQISITVTPATATVLAGRAEQFAAEVTGTTNTGVVWSVAIGPGTISSTGLYAAPSVLTENPTSVTIQAVSVADPTVIGRATVQVVIIEDPNRICFDRQILPIFQSNCAMSGCHDPATREHGYDFTKASGVLRGVIPGNAHDSKIYEMITGKGDDDGGDDDPDVDEDDIMPPPPRAPLTPAQIDLIRRWIDAGADTATCPPPVGACDTTNVTYSSTIRPLVEARCLGCHNGGNSGNKNVDLSTHAGIQRVAQSGQLVGALSHSLGFTPMPMNGAKLDDCTLDKIRAWIVRGTPNN